MKDVIIMLGSKSDIEYAKESLKVLDKLGVSCEVVVSSIHRTPDKTIEIAKSLESKGFKAVICMAGYAAHLPGVISALSSLPIIAVPLSGSPLTGLDALYSQQMPAGVPVAAMTIGTAGAINAAIFAARIIALSNEVVKEKLRLYVKDMADKASQPLDSNWFSV